MTNQNPLVSIIINNYNYGSFIAEAIDSALKQTYSTTEVIVVDDGSTDNSRAIIASYGEKIIPILKENGGQASAYNAGFAASSGQIICFLDSDDFFHPEKVALIVKEFQADSEIGWCFHAVKLIDYHSDREIGLTRQSGVGKCDLRDLVAGGTTPHIPPSSGLCFRQHLLAQMMPIPEVFIGGADDYPRKIAPAVSPGFMLKKPLTTMRVHDQNNYTGRGDRPQLQTRNMIAAYFLKANFPQLSKICNRMFARGLSAYWKYKVVYFRYGVPYQDGGELIKNYLTGLSLGEKAKVILRAVYYSIGFKTATQVNLELKSKP